MGIPNHLQLSTGTSYDLDNHKFVGPFNFETDILGAMVKIERAGGHFNANWNVLIHSVCVGEALYNMTRNVDLACAGLNHDLHEGVMGDIMTPIARAIGGRVVYDQINVLKDHIQICIEDHLGLVAAKRFNSWIPTGEVKMMDLAALLIEKKMYSVPESIDWNLPQPPPEYMQAMYGVMKQHEPNPDHPTDPWDTIKLFKLRLAQWSK